MCGTEKIVSANSMVEGNTKSCGCLNAEHAQSIGYKVGHFKEFTHGNTRGGKATPEYAAWMNMKNRCCNKNYNGYQNYGGRGIKVCDRWLDSFENFIEDIGERSRGMSLDRINVNGNYEPSNCRWATAKEQANNTRFNKKITVFGKTKTIAEWSDISGIKYSTLKDRLKSGWSDIDVVTIPPKQFLTHSINANT